MCQCIAQVDSALVGARNKDSETPFFLAPSMVKRKPSFVFSESVVALLAMNIPRRKMMARLFFTVP
jgi:hypothetical protein